MKMQIVSCPRCGTFLLHDTDECHSCGYIVNQRPAAQAKSRSLPTDQAVQDDMEACPTCGETCRTGLVRCWNCSSFLRPDIEASYRRMQQAGRQAVEHVELQILEATSVTEEDSLRRSSSSDDFVNANRYSTDDSSEDDDFELSMDAQFGENNYENDSLNDDSQLPLFSDADLPPTAVEVPGSAGVAESIPLQAPAAEIEPMPSSLPAVESPAFVEPPVRAEASEPPVRADAEEPPERLSSGEVLDPKTVELLKIAADEEQDIQQVRKTQRSKDTFVIYCPQGCKIRVKEKHRGMSGKCPRCQSEFVVPRKPVPKKVDAADQSKPEAAPESRFKKWLPEIRLHTVDPQKLRIKADSLLNECQAVDLGFSAEDLLVATLILGKFGANVKKTPPVRQAMIEHFLKQGTVDALTVAAKKIYTKEQLGQLNVAQPAPEGTESLFGDIPVFGVNRIAVRIPKMADDVHPKYLSFCLSEFRAFVEAIQSVCGIENFGTNVKVPLNDVYTTHKCHLSQAPVLQLAQVSYYEKDPGFKLEISGWKCAACGIVVSEAARAEAKLGGANGKALAKAKCPKCNLKFGSLPFYQLGGAGNPTSAPEQPPAES